MVNNNQCLRRTGVYNNMFSAMDHLHTCGPHDKEALSLMPYPFFFPTPGERGQ
jgi:hypothetical protein